MVVKFNLVNSIQRFQFRLNWTPV